MRKELSEPTLEQSEFTVRRTGQAPLRFTGYIVADEEGKWCHGKEQNRYHDLRVYITGQGKIIAALEYVSHWEGEVGYAEASVLDRWEDVVVWFEQADPTAHVVGYPNGKQFRAKQERLLDSIQRRYSTAVTELFQKVIEAGHAVVAERVL